MGCQSPKSLTRAGLAGVMTYPGKLGPKQDEESTQAWGWVPHGILKTKLGEEYTSSMENGFIDHQISKVSVC